MNQQKFLQYPARSPDSPGIVNTCHNQGIDSPIATAFGSTTIAAVGIWLIRYVTSDCRCKARRERRRHNCDSRESEGLACLLEEFIANAQEKNELGKMITMRIFSEQSFTGGSRVHKGRRRWNLDQAGIDFVLLFPLKLEFCDLVGGRTDGRQNWERVGLD